MSEILFAPATPVQEFVAQGQFDYLVLGGDRIAQSLLEGGEYHRYCACVKLPELGDNLYYLEWQPNHSSGMHRYIIALTGSGVYVSMHPLSNGGRAIRLEQVADKDRAKAILRLMHRCYKSDLVPPKLSRLADITGLPIKFVADDGVTYVEHKQGRFYTHSVYGNFVQLPHVEVVCREDGDGYVAEAVQSDHPGTIARGRGDSEAEAMSEALRELRTLIWEDYICDPQSELYLWHITGALGYVDLAEGRLWVYPSGDIRLVPVDMGWVSPYSDVIHIQGDLVAMVGARPPCLITGDGVADATIDRHSLHADKPALVMGEWGLLFVREDCSITASHPEHGEARILVPAGSRLCLLPGTSRPYQKEGVD